MFGSMISVFGSMISVFFLIHLFLPFSHFFIFFLYYIFWGQWILQPSLLLFKLLHGLSKVFKIPHIETIIMYLSFIFFWLTSFNMKYSSTFHIVVNYTILLFFTDVIFHCAYTIHLHNPLLYHWASWLISILSCLLECCNELWYACVF